MAKVQLDNPEYKSTIWMAVAGVRYDVKEGIGMLLVPRQLLRSGMTGNVPYYGGRFTPAQAYAASHPSAPTAPGLAPAAAGMFGLAPVPAADPVESPTRTRADSQAALQHLLSTGVITQGEYDQLLARVAR